MESNKEQSLILVRLANGETLIGELHGQQESAIVITGVEQIVESQGNLGFVSYMPYSTGTFVVNIIGAVVTDPSPALAAEYKRAKSPIFTPPAKSIITG